MLTQGEFWILVLVGLLIANLALLFYVKQDFDKKVSGFSQEVEGVKESLFHVKQDFDKRIIELLQEVSDIKAGKNASELVQQIKDVKENLIHIQQNFGNKLMDLLQEVNDIKGRLILDLDKKVGKLSQEVDSIREKIEKVNTEMKQLERQTRERIDHIAKLLTEPILDESELNI
jgi:parvulin-like peptidyl-prolyl isomerase